MTSPGRFESLERLTGRKLINEKIDQQKFRNFSPGIFELLERVKNRKLTR